MSELDIDRMIIESEKEIKRLRDIKKKLEEEYTFTLITNTAFLQNAGITKAMDLFKNFPDWVKIKHEQHWKGLCDSECEITFKIKRKVPEVKDE